jgi:glycosyltransferase involved in cell wall biosynthesis
MTSLSNKKYKFLLLTSHSLPDTSGSGIHALRFARFINNQGDYASILTFNRNCKLPSKETIENVLLYRIPYFNKGLIMKFLSLPIVIIYYILFVVKNDIVFIYGGRIIAWEIFILVSKIAQKKIVFRSLLEGIDDINSLIINRTKLHAKINKVLLGNITCYYSINTYFTSQYINVFDSEKNILTLPQGIDTTEFFSLDEEKKKELRKLLGLPLNTTLIISIGFLLQRKDYLNIFKQLQRLGFEYNYIVLGEYNPSEHHFLSEFKAEMNRIQKQGRKLLGDRISFLGHRSDAVKYLQCSDCFLMNSVQEGLPNVLLEAMACEIPIVIRNLKGVSNFVVKNLWNAMIFNTPDEIPQILNRLFHEDKLRKRIAINARKDIEEKYSFVKIYPQLLRQLEKK